MFHSRPRHRGDPIERTAPHPAAILFRWLMLQLAANLLAAFYRRNPKPAIRDMHDTLQIFQFIKATPVRPPGGCRAPYSPVD